MIDIESLHKRFVSAQTIKTPWRYNYQEGFRYVAPQRELSDNETNGAKKDGGDIVFDSSAGVALDSFVSNIQSSLVPPAKPWLYLTAGVGIEDDKKAESAEALEKISAVAFSYIHASNFDTEMATSLYDLGMGVGALLVNKGTKEKPLEFTSVHIDELYLENGPLGRIETVFRKRKIEIRNIAGTWDDADIPDEFLEQLESDSNASITVIEAGYPEKIDYVDMRDNGKVKRIDGFCYVVYEEETKKQLVRREQRSNPWIIFRWNRLPGEVYSRGPVMRAMPDIKSLNKVKELLLKKGSRDVYGVYTYLDDGVVNLDNISFGGMTSFIPVESNGGSRGPSISALPGVGDLNLGQFLFTDMQNSVFKTMFAEPLGRIDAPVKTATEIAYRQAELFKRIGSAFGRLQFELMVPLVNRILHVLEELDLIDMSGFSVDGHIVNVQYISPLALAQDQEELMAMRQYAEVMIGTFGPQLGLAMLNPDKFAQEVAKRLHVPQNILPTEEQFAQMKQALTQQAAQQAAQQQPQVVPMADNSMEMAA